MGQSLLNPKEALYNWMLVQTLRTRIHFKLTDAVGLTDAFNA